MGSGGTSASSSSSGEGGINFTPDGGAGAGGGSEFDGCKKVDVLFVVDNSTSMEDEQQALVSAFPGFVKTMKQKLAKAESYHVGVVTSDAYTANIMGCQDIGDLVVQTGGDNASQLVCGPFEGGAHYLDGNDPNLDELFQCVATVGTGGDGDERVMRALLNAVNPARSAPGACNEGFARPDSLLVVVLITDEDDGCTTGPCAPGSSGNPTTWYNELVGYRGGLADNIVVLSIIANPPCDTSAKREIEFTLKFEHGLVGDVCALDYNPFFDYALPEIGAACDHFTPPQ